MMETYDEGSTSPLYGRELIKQLVASLPEFPGVYRLLDLERRSLYIGKAKDLKKRVIYYAKEDLSPRLRHMVSQVKHLEYTVTKTEAEALLLEANLIKNLQPRFNILLRDDKSFPYLKITTNHPIPQLCKYRGKTMQDGKFFGPFASTRHLEETMKEITKIFKLRSCNDSYFAMRKNPCLLYQIKRCSAPCVGKIDQASYNMLVLQALDFLSGKVEGVISSLKDEMQELSTNMQYEAAAVIRDRIKALMQLQHNNSVLNVSAKDADVIAIASEGHDYCIQVFIYRGGKFFGNRSYFPQNADDSSTQEVLMTFIGLFYQTRIPPAEIILNHSLPNCDDLAKALKELHGNRTKLIIPQRQSGNLTLVQHAEHNAKLSLQEKVRRLAKYRSYLEKLQQLFDLPKSPKRVEVYDNSHIMGQHAVGVMIVATEEGFAKDEYRKYNIKSLDQSKIGGDDYQMLREVLERRLSHLATEPESRPDLMLIDGGKGHLAVALDVVGRFDNSIKVASIAKGPNRNSGGEFFHQEHKPPFTLSNSDPVMQYLQVLRDEAHGFAIRTHRHKRGKIYQNL